MAKVNIVLQLEAFISRALQAVRTTFNLPVWKELVPLGLELRISSQIVLGLVVDVRQPEKSKKKDFITEQTLVDLIEQLKSIKEGGMDFTSSGQASTGAIVALSRMAPETRYCNLKNKYIHYELHKDLSDATVVLLVFIALPKKQRKGDLYQSGSLLRGGEKTVYTVPYNTNGSYNEWKNEIIQWFNKFNLPIPKPRQHSPPPTSDMRVIKRVQEDEEKEKLKILIKQEEIKARKILMEEQKIKQEEEQKKLKEIQRIQQEEKMQIEEELIRKKKQQQEERIRIEEIEQQRIKKEQEEKLKQASFEFRMKRLDEFKQQSVVRAQNKASREQRKVEIEIRKQQRQESQAKYIKREEERKQEEQELIKEHEQNEIIRQQEEQKRKMSEEVRKFNKEQRDENKRERERKRKEIRDKQEVRNKELEQDKENKKKAQVILEQLLQKEKIIQNQTFLPNPLNEKEKEQSKIDEIIYKQQTNQILEELAKFGSAALDLGIGCYVDGAPLHANVTQPGADLTTHLQNFFKQVYK
ncbi:MAG: hypothetical protein EZS28_018895 [Streblomastix strix]|uniref:Uncharacterized protein n=1 Tax=Streblomastix strix TaxID=222440 RepID=A0A5J4VT41_9EUKA|nr:MAG: hypothetical protein EZS28_018895 [Streblomastix strix]